MRTPGRRPLRAAVGAGPVGCLEASLSRAEPSPELPMSRVSRALLPPLGSPAGPGGGERAGAAEEGSGSGSLAKSLQRAEALWRQCVPPGLKRLLPPGRPESAEEESSGGEEEEGDGARPGPARVERTFQALSRGLCVQEDPPTETFWGHLRPEATQGPFSFHPARAHVARRCATLHALLQHRHRLLLARHYSRRLRAASAFVRRLRALEHHLPSGCEEGASRGHLLRELCEELRTHTAHWDGLQRRMRSDPWLLPMLLQRHEVVLRMKQALSLLALHAVCLLERLAEDLLRDAARAAPPLHQLSFSEFFQGLEIYNQVVGDRALQQAFAELQAASGAACGLWREAGNRRAFPVERVLGILAAERGKLAAQKLYPCFLRRHAAVAGPEPVPWEASADSWLLDGASQACQSLPSLSVKLHLLCQEEEELMLLLLGELVASSDSLGHHVLNRPKQEKPLDCQNPSDAPGESDSASLPSWKSVRWLDASFTEAAAVLYAQYRPLLWRAAASYLAHQLELCLPLTQFQEGAAAALSQQLSHTLVEARMSPENTEELQSLLLRLLMREVLQYWDQGFCRALGSGLTDKCVVRPSSLGTGAACSPTAQLLQSLFLPLTFSLRCLDAHHVRSSGLRLELLSLLVATSHASCYWVMSKAYQHLASWSLSQFLLVTQGDLQLLKAETDKTLTLVSSALPQGRRMQSPLVSQQELELGLQIHSMATRLQLFARDVLQLFSLDCKRMSADIFGQTMPLGKHWRLALRTELPSSPSEYASAAAQTVLGQVLQGIQLLPRDSQVPALGEVTTAFLEAWMEHILAQKIKFSLQGALQLKQDFNLVRELLHSEDFGLSPEIRQLVLSLRIFQQVDNAIACLLQQPSKTSLPLNTWDAFHKCCSYNGIRTQEAGPSSLNSLESLEGLPAQMEASVSSQAGELLSRLQGGGCSPETYLSPTQQEWLALRLHGGRRWKVPGLPCMNRTSEP